ncbi:MAG TPA: hypothetical protein VFF73_17590 [Planctomycetota bacterium]|nr:hypothetical protein [Planctomycetota bacterium]
MRWIVFAVVGLALAGCARVEVKKATDASDEEGVHFYEPEPYLLVAKQPAGADPKPAKGNEVKADKPDAPKGPTYETSIVWLPNTKKRYVVNVTSGWGTVDGSVKLTNGWMLAELGSKMDSKGPETITAVSGFVTALAGAVAKGDNNDEPPLRPGLYKFVFDDNGSVKQLQPVKLLFTE